MSSYKLLECFAYNSCAKGIKLAQEFKPYGTPEKKIDTFDIQLRISRSKLNFCNDI